MWQTKLQNNYDSYDEWKAYAMNYGLHSRLGYKTPRDAWNDNPMIQGSTRPEDFKKVES